MKEKILNFLNNELNVDLHKMEREIINNEFYKLDSSKYTPNIYFKKDVDSNMVQLIATINEEQNNVINLFTSIHSQIDKIDETALKGEIKNNEQYLKLFAVNNKVQISLKRDGNTFSIAYYK